MSKIDVGPKTDLLYILKSNMSRTKPWNRSQQQLDFFELTDEFFENNQGCIRWDNIRTAYFNGFIDIDRVVDLSLKWRDQTEYLWLDGFDSGNMYVRSCFVKAAKRGNDVYKHRLNKKFSFLDKLDPIYFFGDWDSKKYTPMLFITLTIDPKRFPIDIAWKSISKHLHCFETKLRQKYGKNVKFRVFESHKSGFPHCHVVYYFSDAWFSVFKYKDKYRIINKHKKAITKMWDMGNVDIQAVQDTHGAFNEVKKYITKTIFSDKGNLTNAMMCLHQKQMYCLSKCDPLKKQRLYCKQHNITEWREQEKILHLKLKEWSKHDFIGAIWGSQIYFEFYMRCGGLAEPRATALVNGTLHNCNILFPQIVKWRFVGCVLWSDLYQFMPEINDDWVIIADPPPELEAYLGFLHRDISLDEVELNA